MFTNTWEPDESIALLLVGRRGVGGVPLLMMPCSCCHSCFHLCILGPLPPHSGLSSVFCSHQQCWTFSAVDMERSLFCTPLTRSLAPRIPNHRLKTLRNVKVFTLHVNDTWVNIRAPIELRSNGPDSRSVVLTRHLAHDYYYYLYDSCYIVARQARHIQASVGIEKWAHLHTPRFSASWGLLRPWFSAVSLLPGIRY